MTSPEALLGERPGGDPALVREEAAQWRRAGGRLDSAAASTHTAVRTVGDDAWSGSAAEAARALLTVLVDEQEAAGPVHRRAANALDDYADVLEGEQQQWDEARRTVVAELAAVYGRAGLVLPSPAVLGAQDLAAEARRRVETAADEAAAVLDGLLPVGAVRQPQPQPDQALSFGDHVGDFFGAAWQTSVDTASFLFYDFSPIRAALDPDGVQRDSEEFRGGLGAAAQDPLTALDAALNLPALRAGRYGEFLGGLAPDAALGLATAGVGTAAVGAARAGSAVRRVERLREQVRVAREAGDMVTISRLHRELYAATWRARVADGVEFNLVNRRRYPFNEVQLETPGSVGYRRVDSYVPDEAIVERKFTDLSTVRPQTARRYLDQLYD